MKKIIYIDDIIRIKISFCIEFTSNIEIPHNLHFPNEMLCQEWEWINKGIFCVNQEVYQVQFYSDDIAEKKQYYIKKY